MKNLGKEKNSKGLSILVILLSIIIIAGATIGAIMLLQDDNTENNKVVSESNAENVNKTSNTVVENTDVNETTNNEDETKSEVKEKITKRLEDEKWVSENVMMKTSSFMNEENEYLELQGEQTIKCYYSESAEMAYVIASSEEDLSMQCFVVTCVDEEVKATPITENPVHSEHNEISFNKDTVLVKYGNMGDVQNVYYAVENGNVRILSGVGYQEDADENKSNYKLLNSEGTWEECSKEEYNKHFDNQIEKEGRNYFDIGMTDFVEI